ncbi:MAG TPA: sulfite oxidase-like oxidoreductase [Candidatus Polarisedimenticolaceae bacterium]|nr:sulfite oxidase-like oxidoreductase [Candidatus Polarisedimenticolaceae bacterium]
MPSRLPPGQTLTEKWPVLTYGDTPRADLGTWTFRCYGKVEAEVSWTWAELMRLPQIEVRSDIHCVTKWSRYDNVWKGVAVREVLARVKVLHEAVAVMAHSEGGYTTNIPLADLRADGVILATRHDGAELSADHGGPCRLVVPHLYFWKSAKWIRAFEFLDVDAPGFWEVNGYHLYADPWKEERYSDQETDAMQRMRAEAAKKRRARSR